MKPALIAVMLALAMLAHADEYEKWCAPITEIYGVCSPELVANWLEHQKPSEPIAPTLAIDLNATLGNTSAESALPAIEEANTSLEGAGPDTPSNLSSSVSPRITSIILNSLNITYSVNVPGETNILIICPGYIISRTNATMAKTITITKRGAKLSDFQNCYIHDRENNREITDKNIITRAIR